MFKPAFVVPVYQHGNTLAGVLDSLRGMQHEVIVVNDGSDDYHAEMIRQSCEAVGVTLLERESNGGKGAAVIDGIRLAKAQGYSHAFQLDADGQHAVERAREFLVQAEHHPDAMILGYPRYDSTVPIGRRIARWLTHVWVWINTLSLAVRDSMCGFRVYPVDPALAVIDAGVRSRHMEFDTEICVRACWRGIKIINLPVEVHYPREGHSNFAMWRDNARISWMHTRLFFGMLLRSPCLILRRLRAFARDCASG